MVYLQTENPNFGIFWKALEVKNGISYDHLVYLIVVWYELVW
jgi:hypothetical protein